MAGVFGFVWFHARRAALPVFVAIGVWLVIANSGAYKLQFQGLEAEYQSKVKLTAHRGPGRGVGVDQGGRAGTASGTACADW